MALGTARVSSLRQCRRVARVPAAKGDRIHREEDAPGISVHTHASQVICGAISAQGCISLDRLLELQPGPRLPRTLGSAERRSSHFDDWTGGARFVAVFSSAAKRSALPALCFSVLLPHSSGRLLSAADDSVIRSTGCLRNFIVEERCRTKARTRGSHPKLS